jgi:hypothetical protein
LLHAPAVVGAAAEDHVREQGLVAQCPDGLDPGGRVRRVRDVLSGHVGRAEFAHRAQRIGPGSIHRLAVMPGKRVQFDDETWQALDLLAEDRMQTFQELAEEAFADVLKKYGRPVGLKEALRKSAGHSATVHRLPAKKRQRKRSGKRQTAD